MIKNKKGSFLDPESNARGIGIVLVIIGGIQLLFALMGNPYVTDSQASMSGLTLIEGVLLVISGYGLVKKRKIGLYGLSFLLLLSIGIFFYNLGQGFTFTESLSFSLIIYIVLILWLHRLKDTFQ